MFPAAKAEKYKKEKNKQTSHMNKRWWACVCVCARAHILSATNESNNEIFFIFVEWYGIHSTYNAHQLVENGSRDERKKKLNKCKRQIVEDIASEGMISWRQCWWWWWSWQQQQTKREREKKKRKAQTNQCSTEKRFCDDSFKVSMWIAMDRKRVQSIDENTPKLYNIYPYYVYIFNVWGKR